jgi:hypothetical protein
VIEESLLAAHVSSPGAAHPLSGSGSWGAGWSDDALPSFSIPEGPHEASGQALHDG